MADRAHLERLTKELANQGRLIEAGWVGLRIACGLVNAPADQLREMRLAFLGGAQHVFNSIMGTLDPGDEPTDADLRRMDLISAELTAAADELIANYQQDKRAPEPKPEPELESPPTLGDKPIQEQYRERMKALARVLDYFLNGETKPKENGFVLMMFSFGDAGRINYISNADRADVVATLKHQLARFEGQPDVQGTA